MPVILNTTNPRVNFDPFLFEAIIALWDNLCRCYKLQNLFWVIYSTYELCIQIVRPTVAGIHGGDEGCYSIALSGGYEDDLDYGECFTYTGEGMCWRIQRWNKVSRS